MEEVAEAPRSIPMSLKVVGWIFIIQGTCSVLSMVVGWIAGRGSIDLGVINVLVGWGLLDLKAIWRTVALVFIWLALIVLPLAVLIVLRPREKPLVMQIFGMPVGTLPAAAALAFLAGVFLLSLWQVRVL